MEFNVELQDLKVHAQDCYNLPRTVSLSEICSMLSLIVLQFIMFISITVIVIISSIIINNPELFTRGRRSAFWRTSCGARGRDRMRRACGVESSDDSETSLCLGENHPSTTNDSARPEHQIWSSSCGETRCARSNLGAERQTWKTMGEPCSWFCRWRLELLFTLLGLCVVFTRGPC